MRSMRSRSVSVFALAVCGAAMAGPGGVGDPTDMYVVADAVMEVHQFDNVPPNAHVPGNYTGALPPPYGRPFSNAAQLSSNLPYLATYAGQNKVFVGGSFSLQMIDASTGANIMTVATGARRGPAVAPNGNIVVGGPGGVTQEYDINGNLVNNINIGYGDGENLYAFQGNNMYVVRWDWMAGPTTIQVHNFNTGNLISVIPVPFKPQEIAFGPDGNLYASALYEQGMQGLWRYNSVLGTWSHFINTTTQSGWGPHGFAFDPTGSEVRMAFATGEIYRYDAGSGAFLSMIANMNTKLTDIYFIPEPATMALLAPALLIALRRR